MNVYYKGFGTTTEDKVPQAFENVQETNCNKSIVAARRLKQLHKCHFGREWAPSF